MLNVLVVHSFLLLSGFPLYGPMAGSFHSPVNTSAGHSKCLANLDKVVITIPV